MQENELATAKKKGKYLSSRDLATIAIFAAVLFVMNFFTARSLSFLPGAQRTPLAFPLGFITATVYLITRKPGIVGTTWLISFIFLFMTDPFPPMLFGFVIGAIAAESIIMIKHFIFKQEMGKLSISLMAGTFMLAWGIGVTIGLLLFFPSMVLRQTATQILLATYIIFNGILPFVLGTLGAWVATKTIGVSGIVPPV